MSEVQPTETDPWRPIQVDDPDQLRQLREDPGVEVLDRIEQQRRDLARLLPAPDPELLSEPTRWYFYPWRRSVVHLLGSGAFQALRTDRNRDKITVEEQQRLRRLAVGVVGLSVGHAIAHILALDGACGRIRLADFDEIELSNLNRIPGTVFDLAVNKAVVVARRIAEIDPYLDVDIDPRGLSLDSAHAFVSGLDVVIEECDSFDIKLAVRAAASRARVPLLMATSDRGLLDIERYDLEPDRPPFHGMLGDVAPADLMGLSARDKVPYALRILEPEKLSTRVVASTTEIDETISTWPQLGTDVMLGAASVAAAVRQIGLGLSLPSGRVRVDLQQILGQVEEPEIPAWVDTAAGAGTEPEPAPTHPHDAVVHAARLAPSGGNTQPWKFAVDDSELRIHLDPEQTSGLDIAFRGSYVSIGAALFNARVAAARHHVLGHVTVFPAGRPRAGDADTPVTSLRLADRHDDELATMYEPMLRRVSNRHLTKPDPLPDGVVPALQQAARAEGADLTVVIDRSRLGELAELFGESDRIRFLTEHLHREMMRELRWPGTDSLEWGLDVRTLELDQSDLVKLAVAKRPDVMARLAEQDLGRALGESSRDRVAGTSGLVVVVIDGTDPADYVRGGQAVERVWVRAEQLGLSVQVMSPVFVYAVDPADYDELSPRYSEHLRELHRELHRLTGVGHRHVALTMRIGYAPGISARSRRLPAERTVRAA